MAEEPYEWGAEIVGKGRPTDDGPSQIELSHDRVACARHNEPFRDDWPNGYGVFATELATEVLNDEEFIEAVDGEVEQIEAALDEKPLCERVSKTTLIYIYTKTEIGSLDRCAMCREVRLGTPYTMRISPSDTRRVPHLCFTCIVYNLRGAN